MNRRFKHTIVTVSHAFLLAAGFGALSLGCSDSDEQREERPGRTAPEIQGDRRIPFSPASDREFAEFFAEHHRMAIEMAMHETMRGENAEVKELAQSIIDMQTAELATLESAISSMQDAKAPPAMPQDPHMQAELEHMASLSGAELDSMFLIDMIAHHAAGLAPAHRAEERLERAELQTLAHSMFDAQGMEIGDMRTLLMSMNAMDAGEDMAPSSSSRADFGLVGDRRIPLTPANDVEFIDFFVPHHESAIAMADEVIARGADAEVRAMAQSMRDTQMMEVETMKAKRMSLAGSEEPSAPPEDSHMRPEMTRMMQSSGAELDRMFLEEMIPHHAAGLPTAHRAVPHVQDATLRELADTMYDAQAREVGEMHHMLEAMGGPL